MHSVPVCREPLPERGETSCSGDESEVVPSARDRSVQQQLDMESQLYHGRDMSVFTFHTHYRLSYLVHLFSYCIRCAVITTKHASSSPRPFQFRLRTAFSMVAVICVFFRNASVG